MNEFQAPIGLRSLDIVSDEINKRKCIAQKYGDLLSDINGIELLKIPKNLESNYSFGTHGDINLIILMSPESTNWNWLVSVRLSGVFIIKTTIRNSVLWKEECKERIV